MGYGYGRNQATGRMCLACDFCGAANGETVKVRCPYGYCPATASCPRCKKEKNVDAKEPHRRCKERMDEDAAKKAEVESVPITVTLKSTINDCVLTEDLYAFGGTHFFQVTDLIGRVWNTPEAIKKAITAHKNWTIVAEDSRALQLLNSIQ